MNYYNYPADKAAFKEDPSPEAASQLTASAMYTSAKGEISDAELLEAILMIRNFVYKSMLS